MMDEDEITQRLRDAGREQVPGDVRSDHLTRMRAATPVVEKQKRSGRLAVAAATFAGFAVGSTGFAMAGALPDPAQGVAHDVLSVVQVEVDDPYRNRGECVSAAARANGEDEAAEQRAKDACPKGKPDHAGKGRPDGVGNGRPDQAGTPGGPNGRPDDGDTCKGPPPWAGKGAKGMTPEEKQQLQGARAAECGRAPEDRDPDDQAEALEEQQEREAEAQQDQGEPEQTPAEPEADQPAEPGPAPMDPPADLPAPLEPDAGAQDTDTTAETDPAAG